MPDIFFDEEIERVAARGVVARGARVQGVGRGIGGEFGPVVEAVAIGVGVIRIGVGIEFLQVGQAIRVAVVTGLGREIFVEKDFFPQVREAVRI